MVAGIGPEDGGAGRAHLQVLRLHGNFIIIYLIN